MRHEDGRGSLHLSLQEDGAVAALAPAEGPRTFRPTVRISARAASQRPLRSPFRQEDTFLVFSRAVVRATAEERTASDAGCCNLFRSTWLAPHATPRAQLRERLAYVSSFFPASTSDAQSLVRQNSNAPAPAPIVLSARRVLYTRQTLFHSFRTHVPAFRFCVVFFVLLLLMFSPMTNIGRSYVRAVCRCDARGVALGS